MPHTQVLIAGAGPTGLVLALSLVQNGISVRIIEKLDIPSDAQRGVGAQPRSLEIYKFLGILDDLQTVGRPVLDMKHYDSEGRLVAVKPLNPENTKPTPDRPFVTPYMIGQERFCRVLREHLKNANVGVEFCSEILSSEERNDDVISIIKKGDHTETIESLFVVGADGARGSVRRQLGLKFLGESKDDFVLAVGDIQMTGSVDKEYGSMFGAPPNDMIAILPTQRALDEDVYMFRASGPGLDVERAMIDHEHFFEFIRKTTKIPDLKFGDVKTLNSYKPNNFRVVDTFRKGRIFVAGDAAHIHSATGGQGLNSSVMDSFNLAWKLALVIKGHSPPTLLDTYTEERLPVIQHMLQLTASLLQKQLDPNRKGSSMDRPSILYQLGVNYRSSSIVLDEFQEEDTTKATIASPYESDGVLRAGDRAPDAPHLLDVRTQKETTAFDIFRPFLHTVLLLKAVDGNDAVVTATSKYVGGLPRGVIQTVVIYAKGTHAPSSAIDADLVLEDTTGHAFDAYSLQGQSRIIVIRPDGYIGAIARGVEGIRRYFSKVFHSVQK